MKINEMQNSGYKDKNKNDEMSRIKYLEDVCQLFHILSFVNIVFNY